MGRFVIMLGMQKLLPIVLTLWSTTVFAQGDRDARRALRGAIVEGNDGTVLSSYICRNFLGFAGVSFGGCGAASDLFSVQPDTAELSHYRLEHAFRLIEGAFELRLSLGGGMAEGQLGQDAPGFFLKPDTSQQTIEAAGPEAVIALDLWWPTAFERNDFRIRLDVGMTWLPGWKEVGGSSDDIVPFGVLTTNAEF